MPNIKQQKKRVRQATAARIENLHWRSTAKTLSRGLRKAVTDGDQEAIGAAHKALNSWLDKAAARGALHKNTAARRKAQAAKLVK